MSIDRCLWYLINSRRSESSFTMNSLNFLYRFMINVKQFLAHYSVLLNKQRLAEKKLRSYNINKPLRLRRLPLFRFFFLPEVGSSAVSSCSDIAPSLS